MGGRVSPVSFRVTLDRAPDGARRVDLRVSFALLLGVTEATLDERLAAPEPWLVDVADQETAEALARRVRLAFQVGARATPVVGVPTSRAAGLLAALDELARERAVRRGREGHPSHAPPEPDRPAGGDAARPAGSAAGDEPIADPRAEGVEVLELVEEARPRPQTRPPPSPTEPPVPLEDPRARSRGRSRPGPSPVLLGATVVVALAAGSIWYARRPKPPAVEPARIELATGLTRLVDLAERTWRDDGRFPPSARTPPAGFPCDVEGRPRKVTRDVSGFDDGVWLHVDFPPATSYVEYQFVSGGAGAYAWYVAEAAADPDCDGVPEPRTRLGVVQGGTVHSLSR